MVEVVGQEQQPKIIYMSAKTVISVVIAGLVLGAFAYLFTVLLDRSVLQPIFCNGQENFAICSNSERIAANIATVFAAVAGMFILLQFGVYRPLLIAAAAAVVLWGSTAWLQTSWIEELLWSVGLYALVYTTLVWLSRIRNFTIALVAIIVVVAAARILPML